MGLFDVNGEPVFLKEDSTAEQELAEMRSLLANSAGETRKRLERDIRITEAGIYGENQISFQLRNSHLPLFVMHDLYFEHEGLSSQIDFLVVTPYVTLVIECKNLVGNIEINDRGDFIRTFNYGHGNVREGMDSPITQNERHLQLMKAIKQDGKGTVLKLANEHYFRDFYKSVVVLANPKTILDDREAKKEIKEQVIRADALIARINELNESSRSNGRSSKKEMQEMAERWLARSTSHMRDIAAVYGISRESAQVLTGQQTTTQETRTEKTPGTSSAPLCPKCGAPMVLRTAMRGERAGKRFWGCSRYPSCRGIVNIDE